MNFQPNYGGQSKIRCAFKILMTTHFRPESGYVWIFRFNHVQLFALADAIMTEEVGFDDSHIFLCEVKTENMSWGKKGELCSKKARLDIWNANRVISNLIKQLEMSQNDVTRSVFFISLHIVSLMDACWPSKLGDKIDGHHLRLSCARRKMANKRKLYHTQSIYETGKIVCSTRSCETIILRKCTPNVNSNLMCRFGLSHNGPHRMKNAHRLCARVCGFSRVLR